MESFNDKGLLHLPSSCMLRSLGLKLVTKFAVKSISPVFQGQTVQAGSSRNVGNQVCRLTFYKNQDLTLPRGESRKYLWTVVTPEEGAGLCTCHQCRPLFTTQFQFDLNLVIPLCLFLIIYFTYNSDNTTTKDNSFVYSDMIRLEWIILRLWLEPYMYTR